MARLLARQFEEGTVKKTYLARVIGHPESDEFFSTESISKEPNRAGGREIGGVDGQSAETLFRVLRRDAETTLLKVHPITGRTHQIRLHAAHAGFPIAGDPRYGTGASLEAPATLGTDEPPMMLHAWKLQLRHPVSEQDMHFEASPPDWLDAPLP